MKLQWSFRIGETTVKLCHLQTRNFLSVETARYRREADCIYNSMGINVRVNGPLGQSLHNHDLERRLFRVFDNICETLDNDLLVVTMFRIKSMEF